MENPISLPSPSTAPCTIHTKHCTLHTKPCTLNTARYKLNTAQCILHTKHCTLHTVHCTLHTKHCTLHTKHCTLNTAHYILNTAQCILHTAEFAQFTTHTAQYTLGHYVKKPSGYHSEWSPQRGPIAKKPKGPQAQRVFGLGTSLGTAFIMIAPRLFHIMSFFCHHKLLKWDFFSQCNGLPREYYVQYMILKSSFV